MSAPQAPELVFRALSDSTRRAILERLSLGPASVSELAAPFSMALPSFMQHLSVLEEAGLVRSRKEGRVRICTLQKAPLLVVESWLSAQRKLWEQRMDQFDAYVLALHHAGESE